MNALKLSVVVSLAVVVSACCACRRSGNNAPLLGTEWKLSRLADQPVDSGNYRMTLGEEGRISGIGDCNRFSGTYKLTSDGAKPNGGLSIDDNLVSTRMMCPGQSREDAFLKMLGAIDSFTIDGTRLMLIEGGNVLAIFEQFIPTPVPAE